MLGDGMLKAPLTRETGQEVSTFTLTEIKKDLIQEKATIIRQRERASAQNIDFSDVPTSVGHSGSCLSNS